jgi:hypothetical protein
MNQHGASFCGDHVKHARGELRRVVGRVPTLLALLIGCSSALPEHEVVAVTPLTPRRGSRVEIHATARLSKDQCRALIDAYQSKGLPDGQVSVRQPHESGFVPYCVENFDGRGITFNDALWENETPLPSPPR